jgi:hypothetical protein
MVNQDILKYLTEGKKRGFEIPLLKDKLLKAGFQTKDIDEAVKGIKSPTVSVVKPVVPAVNKATDLSVKKFNTTSKKVTEDENPGKKVVSQDSVGASGEKSGVFGKIGKVFSKPTELFNSTKGDGIGGALGFYYVCSILPLIILSVLAWLLNDQIVSLLSKLIVDDKILSPLYLIGSFAVIGFVLLPIFFFVISGFLHGFVKMLKGQGSYGDSFNVVVYGYGPSVLLSWTVILLPILLIWSLVLHVKGLSVVHGISKGKSFGALILMSFVLSLIGSGISFGVWKLSG